MSALLRRAAPAALLVVATLAGCSTQSPSTVSSQASATPSASGSSPASPSPEVTESATPSPTPTTAAAPVVCSSRNLVAKPGTEDSGAGHVRVVITLRNAGATTCTLNGYPRLRMLDTKGKALPLRVTHGGDTASPTVSARTVILARGTVASFDLGYSRVPVGNETTCAGGTLRVTPPQNTTELPVALTLEPCDQGRVSVSPVVAGSGGLAG
jgi:hypothetical protein